MRSANKINFLGLYAVEFGDRVCLRFRPSRKGRESTASRGFISTAGSPSEPDLPTLANISLALRKPAAGSRRTTVGSRYRPVSTSTDLVTTLNLADASNSFPTGPQFMAKIREECSVVVMDGKEEDRASVRFC
jgi:hypothetical protein